jgi:hypothetical protein
MEQHTNGNVARQRIVRSEPEILSILEEYDKSGYTQKEFCEVSDINEMTFYSWLKKYRPKTVVDEVKGFATIELIPAQGKEQLFARIGKLELYKEMPAEYLIVYRFVCA